MEAKNVVVIGAPRSGTTLVAGLLSFDKRVAPSLPECTYVTQLIQHFYNFLHYSDKPRFMAYAINEETLKHIYLQSVNAMLGTVKSHFKSDDYQYLILKDPELTLLTEYIPDFFGADCKVICCVRDPRAVIASMWRVEEKKRYACWRTLLKRPSVSGLFELISQIKQQYTLPSNFFSYYWKMHSSALFAAGKIHVVRYEKIIAQDEVEFQKLEIFLGLPISRHGFGDVPFGFNENDPTHSSGWGEGAKLHNTKTDFRHTLSARQIKKIEKIYAGYNAIYQWW
ncbi:MAG: sulfotransferase family protein [Gallionella sp.]